MNPITFDSFKAQREHEPRRRCFAQYPDIHPNTSGNPYFRPPFAEGIKPVFESMTALRLKRDMTDGHCFCYLNTPEELSVAQEWIVAQGSRVFLRDCLTCSIALSVNMKDVTTGEKTELGQMEYNAKTNDAEAAIESLAEHLAAAIADLPHYAAATLIVAVPARPGKTTRDLPTELAKRIAEKRKLTDLTPHFSYAGTREQLKELPLSERWAAWEGAKLTMTPGGAALLAGNPVILIDDKYQSGVSANFVAMILQQHGAADVYGLYAVKTMRDTDNT